MCHCDFEETGRCWLHVNQLWFEKNFDRLKVGDTLAVYTFAVLERQRLADKAYQMSRLQLDVIEPDYCCQGTRFETEQERIQRIVEYTK